MKKTFTLGTVLTVTTGRLLTKPVSHTDNGIGDLYKILEHMTGDAPFTHTLGRFADECKPELLKAFPELKKADLELLDEMLSQKNGIENWLKLCVSKFDMKPEYEVGQIPPEHHEIKNPITELSEKLQAGNHKQD